MPIDPAAPSTRRVSRLAWRVALIATAAALVIAFVVDRWYEQTLLIGERERTRVAMAPYAGA